MSARRGVFPGVARMDGNVPAVLIYGCQATSELRIFRRSLSSPGKRAKYNAPQKYFSNFFRSR